MIDCTTTNNTAKNITAESIKIVMDRLPDVSNIERIYLGAVEYSAYINDVPLKKRGRDIGLGKFIDLEVVQISAPSLVAYECFELKNRIKSSYCTIQTIYGIPVESIYRTINLAKESIGDRVKRQINLLREYNKEKAL